ncbi:DUF4179 domain-containing protein [Lacticaseibacillus mingshuiensis]|uniref:DUF4179 domain-containing protein n=1 Tax=Lacticaseibacillus mingshuiensis TaxID=2799574 RepID=A0ABW4CE81_9LACO|nr:DUF4179 domain-containing protein [Lacticaseibacillus mingshuiensis]
MKDDKLTSLIDHTVSVSDDEKKRADRTIDRMLEAANAKPRKKHRGLIAAGIGVAAAVALSLGGIFSPQVNRVMAQVPLIGHYFAAFNDAIGMVVENAGYAQQLGQSATSRGITLKLDSAVMQGQIISVSGTATGVPSRDDDWFDAGLSKGNKGSFRVTTMDVEKTGTAKNGKMTYKFFFSGTVNAAESKKALHLPLTIDGFLGHRSKWHFDLTLKPSAVKPRKLIGSVPILGGVYTVKVLGVDEYKGGTSLLKIARPAGENRVYLGSLFVNGGKKDYLLDADTISGTTATGEKYDGYPIKSLPANVSKLTFHRAWYYRPELSERIGLDTLPQTVNATKSNAQFIFEKATLKDNKVTVRYQLTGVTGHSQLATVINDTWPLAIMTTDYVDNHYSSNLGNNYLFTVGQGVTNKVLDVKTGQAETTFDLNQKSGLKGKQLHDLQIQANYAFNENVGLDDIIIPVR